MDPGARTALRFQYRLVENPGELEEGTPVWILGKYDFDAPPPWLDPEDPHPPLKVVFL